MALESEPGSSPGWGRQSELFLMLGFQVPGGWEQAGKDLFLDCGVNVCIMAPTHFVFWTLLWRRGKEEPLVVSTESSGEGRRALPVSHAPGILSVVPGGGKRWGGGHHREAGVGLCTHWCSWDPSECCIQPSESTSTLHRTKPTAKSSNKGILLLQPKSLLPLTEEIVGLGRVGDHSLEGD